MENQIIKELQDMTYLSWSKIRNSSGTAGSFLKSYSELEGKKIYYKLSNFDKINGIIGHECVNEIIVDRLLNILGIPHLHYQLIHAAIQIDHQPFEVYLCASEDFKQKGEGKLALDTFWEIEHLEGETPLDFCIRHGWASYIYEMFVVDYLILNRDRHGANIEVLRNSRKKTLRPAPLFDHGLSLLFNCRTKEAIDAYDILEDKLTNTFLGSRSTQNNLQLIPEDQMPIIHSLKQSDKETLMEGLDGIISQRLQDRIWDMIWERWCIYENFRHTR